MKKTINQEQFIQGFDDRNRGENFTREGRRTLFNYYEELENGIGEDIEYDPIAICGEWSEYETPNDALEDYGVETLEELERKTDTITLDYGGLLVRVF